MPIPVKKYYCQFRCGRKASDLKSTLEHEDRCFNNPKNKACATCNHFEKSDSLYCHRKNYCIENVYDDINKSWNYSFSINGEIKWEGDNLKNMPKTISFPNKMIRPFPRIDCSKWEPILKK